MKKLKYSQGITLIALIITIILMLILAGVVISLTIGENGLIEKSKQAAEKYKIEEIREKVNIEMANVIAKETALGNDVTIDKILQELLENETFESIDKEAGTGVIGDYDIKLKQDEYGDIVIESIEKATGIRITYTLDPKGYTNSEKVSILFTVQGEVKNVTKPDKNIEYPSQGKIEINYPVDKNGTYQFIVENKDGTTITKDVIVDTIDRLLPLSFAITAEQVDKKIVITANAQDAETDGTSVKSGIDKYEYYVKKPTETDYPEKPYTTNEIEISEYGTYEIFVKAYDKAGNPKDCNEEITIDIVNPNILKYGQTVNYSANGVEDWKIFYINEERNETFIITSGYLPTGKVPANDTGMRISGTYGASWHSTSLPTYKTIEPEGRERFMMSWDKSEKNTNIKCVSRLLDTNAWSVFVTDELKEKGATAIGSPTLEMWVESWNELYPEESLACNTSNNNGYYINTGKDAGTSTGIKVNQSGKNNKLYFPYSTTVSSANSYWLSSPFSNSSNYIGQVVCNGTISGDTYWANMYRAVRPVVCIPSDCLKYNSVTSSWDIN